MAVSFSVGQSSFQFDPPANFSPLIESSEDWVPFASFRRQLASKFSMTNFGCERLQDGTYILFPLETSTEKAKPPQANEMESFLETFKVFNELSPKATELLKLVLGQKKKYAESSDFVKANRLALMKLVGQLVVLRREVFHQPAFTEALKAPVIPISAMGDLETSTKRISLRDAFDFVVQQALFILGAQKVYDDLLAHWNDMVPTEEKQARDQAGAAPFWAAQREKFVEFTSQLRQPPDFGSATLLTAPVKKDSLLWFGKEALTDSDVKFQERQTSIRTAYHIAFRQQRKHASLCHDALKDSTAKRPRVELSPPISQAPKPKSSTEIPATFSAPRAFFSSGTSPKNRRPLRPPFRKPAFQLRNRCPRCHKPGHTAATCRAPF